MHLVSSTRKMVTAVEYIGRHAQSIAGQDEYALAGKDKGVFLS